MVGDGGRAGELAAGLTAAMLFGAAPAISAEAWVGRWAVHPSACGFGGNSRTTAALVVNDTSLNWFSGPCRIGKMYKLGHTAYIQARCVDNNDVPVSLEPRGDRLRVTWNRGKAEDLLRCR
jgi:hypothetical protein